MSELIILQEGQSGYDIVAEYVLKYWDKTYYSTAIVSLETSYDGIIYDKHNEVVSSSCGDFEEFLHDWWEGQKFIKINGVKNIDEIEFVPTADVVEVRHGEWKYPPYAPFGGAYEMKRCTVCGYKPDFDVDNPYTKFCPNCGAKMDGERR